jgi:hypothetical protein
VSNSGPASTSTANIFIDHLKLTLAAAKLPPSHAFTGAALPAAEESGEYFKSFVIGGKRESIVFWSMR